MTPASAPPNSVELTPWEQRTLPWRRRLIYIRAVYTFISGVVLSKLSPDAQNLHWRQRLALSILQSKSAVLTPRQRAFSPPSALTGDLIREYCYAKSVSLRSVTASTAGGQHFATPPAVLHIITPPGAPATGPTIYYAHGGGYPNPIAVAGAHSHGSAPRGKTISAKQCRRPPRGPRCWGTLPGRHLTRCRLTARRPTRCRCDHFAWIAMTTEQVSFDANEATDFLDRKASLLFKFGFAPNVDEPWANLLDAPDSVQVWDSVLRPAAGKPVVRKAIVLTGTAEVLMDSNIEFSKVHLRGADLVVDKGTDVPARFPDADYVFVAAVGEAHTQTILDAAVGYDEGNMSRAIREFLKRL
ncbi:conserved hypothetical protein [Verticillium alfalfae VaMs.102]|uniref:Alpha/beta hydrolase fold-3 domain-containing protein n=1 Tax=Verticillium alfalfae (strain VaMs.102 / ATCC MYA-4576 / FGSC 10136) TaxID=526221 RepID=C9SNW8_VERA1|nr:conserved hypothetical protein [Verticillium alfalfae VaMs.102]EEY20483.1 conserved hypothetical protein [Verticillium alfalfae VaMs.102]